MLCILDTSGSHAGLLCQRYGDPAETHSLRLTVGSWQFSVGEFEKGVVMRGVDPIAIGWELSSWQWAGCILIFEVQTAIGNC